MSEKEALVKFIERIDQILEERNSSPKKDGNNPVEDDLSSNTCNFLKKYGHIG
jgi:hypothetical protein